MVIWMGPGFFGFQIRLSIWFPGKPPQGKQYAKDILSKFKSKNFYYTGSSERQLNISSPTCFFFRGTPLWCCTAVVYGKLMLSGYLICEAKLSSLTVFFSRKQGKGFFLLFEAAHLGQISIKIWGRRLWCHRPRVFHCNWVTLSHWVTVSLSHLFWAFFSLSLSPLCLSHHTHKPKVACLRKTVPDVVKVNWVHLLSLTE